jgi:subtilisin family serine protease
MRWSRENFGQASFAAFTGFQAGQAVVGVRDPAQAEEVANAYGVRLVETEQALHAVIVEGNGEALTRIQGSLPSDSRLRYIEPVVRRRYLHQRNDPLTFMKDPATGRAWEWNFGAMHLDRALNLSRGDPNILVGIIDSGFAPVPDVSAQRYAKSWYFIDEATTSRDDTVGHGTFISSIIASTNDDNRGMAGFCGSCRLDVFRVLNLVSYRLAKAIRQLTDDGVRIISFSIGAQGFTYIEADAVNYAISKGVLMVAAAGNESAGVVSYPAAYLQPSGGASSYGLAVGASDVNGNRAHYSNWGNNLSLLAPGSLSGPPQGLIGDLPAHPVEMDASSYQKSTDSTTNARYTYNEGTSFSTPEVAGIAALVWAAKPDLANWQVANILKQSAGGPWSADKGWGVVDAAKAVELATGKSSADSVVLTNPLLDPSPLFSGGAASLTVEARWQDGVVIPSANVTCSAVVGAVRLPESSGHLSNGTAECSFQVPPRSAGKGLTATIQVTDADGNQSSQTLTTKIGDNAAPITVAIPSGGRYGHAVLLRYRISDDSGQARPVITVIKGGTRVATLRGAFALAQATQPHAIRWQAPAAPAAGKRWRFCVIGTDHSANRGSPSCAPLVLR